MNHGTCPALKRGWPAQQSRREAEREARCHAVSFDHWALAHGMPQCRAARQLGLAPGTLAFWEHRWHKDYLAARPRGRPCRRASVPVRNAAIEFLRNEGPGVPLTAVQAAFPELARREAENLRSRFRHLWQLDHRELAHVLHWQRPRAVWAMDHAEPYKAIDGRWPYILAVRDLASGCQLAWLPVLDETADATIDALQWLFLEHGPPLVLKSDNGSGFISAAMKSFLAKWQVQPLFSPPRTPEYNGSIEAGNGALKNLTHEAAARQGRAGYWTADDLEAARCKANELYHLRGPCGPTRQERFTSTSRISLDDRAAFGRTVATQRTAERTKLGHPLDMDLGHVAQAQIDRVAIGCALVEHGYLIITRRLITPPVTKPSSLGIS